MRWSQILRSLFALILFTRVSNAVLVNQTIDDGLGDSLTGLKVQYSPLVGSRGLVWKSQDTCGNCAIIPDRTKARNNTWNSATALSSENVTATFSFQGSAVYIYFINPNVPVTTGVGSTVDCDFLVDGKIAGSYVHAPNGLSELQYNALVYANTGLSNAPHTLMIQAKSGSVVIFDYAQYTIDIPASSGAAPTPTSGVFGTPSMFSTPSKLSTSSKPSTSSKSSASSTSSANMSNTNTAPISAGAIAGAVVGSVAGIGLIALIAVLCRRRARGRTSHDNASAEMDSRHISPFTAQAAPTAIITPRSKMKRGYSSPLMPQAQAEPH